MVTTNIPFRDVCFVTSANPDTHYTQDSSTWYSLSSISTTWGTKDYMLFKLAPIPSSIKHNIIAGIQFLVNLKKPSRGWVEINTNAVDYDINSVTYSNGVNLGGTVRVTNDDPYNIEGDTLIMHTLVEREQLTIGTQAALNAKSLIVSGPTSMKTVLSGGGTPYAVFSYYESVLQSKIVYKSGPNSGYFNPRNATTFSWDYEKANTEDYCAVEEWEQASATFYWKKSTDENYTAVSAGTTKSVSIPANTFPTAATIQWYVEGTDEDGTTTQTSVYSFSTAAGTARATAQSPINTVEDGSAPITFRWTLGSTDGQTPIAVDLWWKRPTESSSNFHVLLNHASGALTSYAAPANTFPAGTIEWVVRAYNVDDTAGPWSMPSSQTFYNFICVAAPGAVEGLNATAVPLTTITWQSSEQQAYEITIDGVVVQKAFGDNVYTWTVPDALTDGSHVISVRVQGQYGLWSQPADVTINVENEPTDTITLTGTFDVDAILSWNTTEEVYIYRDGKKIGKSNQAIFADRFALGTHTYYVEQWLDTGNYNRSNAVTGTVSVECGQIALVSGGEWVPLEYSKSLPVQTYSTNITANVAHVCGATYPVAELSNFYDLSVSISVMFPEDDPAALDFEKMLGKPVVLKNRRNGLIVGLFTQLDKRTEDFYNDYSVIVQQTEWEDFVDDTIPVY